MAYYLVRARPRTDRLAELSGRLARGEFLPLEPFGRAVTRALEGARLDPESGEAVWEDYCSPPFLET